MGNIGMPEILVVLLIVVLLFGAKKIPELASGLGKGLKEFKKAQQESDKDKEGTTAAKTPSPEAEPQKKVS